MTTIRDRQPPTRAEQRRLKAEGNAKAAERTRRRRSIRHAVAAAIAVAVALVALYVVYDRATESATATARPGDYEVGSPGPGDAAPEFTLPTTTGAEVALSDFRGENVLLYIHEGLGCQPCWDQIRDLESSKSKLKAAGVDRLVSITSAPADLLAQKMRDDDLNSLALADPQLKVISDYEANKYGMMGDTRAGHSFLLIDADGQVSWRADYGGAPKYTMYVPVNKILADMKAGRVDQ